MTDTAAAIERPISVATAAQMLGVSPRMVYDLHHRRVLAGYRIGRAIRFDPAVSAVTFTSPGLRFLALGCGNE